ncbi:MAG: 4,4'-diaponeurosporenoate glycosyltransferase [Planctomycetes bacterium]|nr:4,4'-diaponeurosporenoate glycosyltransferase [Planctomycetota bacterium]HRJ78291.1 glycosyltransferase family 2 protein [Planctomycetota bacterium]
MILTASVILTLAALSLLIVLGNVLFWPRVRAAHALGRVSVLVPARNEEQTLPRLLESLRGEASIEEILVANDHSTDRTQDVIDDFSSRDFRIRSMTPAPLPPGWFGKNWACASLAEEAQGEWLLFLDADTKLEPGAVEALLAEVQARQLSFLSCWPALEMRSFAERLLMPMLNFVLLTLYPAPLATLRMEDASLGLGHGACMFMRRAEYLRVGGHAAVRGEIFEDSRLAQLWRRHGLRGLCLDGRGIISVRMYRSLAEIWRGFSKNLFPAFRHQVSFWLFWLLHSAVYLAPFVLMWVPGPTAGLFMASAACVVGARLALAARFGHSWWSALLHPLAQVFVLALGLASWLSVVSGRGVSWKGRRYLQAEAP